MRTWRVVCLVIGLRLSFSCSPPLHAQQALPPPPKSSCSSCLESHPLLLKLSLSSFSSAHPLFSSLQACVPAHPARCHGASKVRKAAFTDDGRSTADAEPGEVQRQAGWLAQQTQSGFDPELDSVEDGVPFA
eukprot:1159964-Pelagomonas_calceolata.AAC.4